MVMRVAATGQYQGQIDLQPPPNLSSAALRSENQAEVTEAVKNTMHFISPSKDVVGLTGRAQLIQRCPVNEEMMLQAMQVAFNMGRQLQLLKDQKKILHQENAVLKEHIEKLPSMLELELHSVYKTLMEKLHTISFKINGLIQTYTKFQNEAISCPYMNAGAFHAHKCVIPHLETCKSVVDAAIDDEFKPLLKFEDAVLEQNEIDLVESTTALGDNSVETILPERFQQLAEKIKNLEKKVALIKGDNTALQKQIEQLKSGFKNTEKALRKDVWTTSIKCITDLVVLNIASIPKTIKDATKLMATATKLIDINMVSGYVERLKVIQTDISALSSQIEEISQAIQGAN